MVMITLYTGQKKRHICIEHLWEMFSPCGRRQGWDDLRIALKHVYHQVWNRSPSQVGCMRQVLRPGALGWPRGMGWEGSGRGESGWGTHVDPWLIHVNVWQKPLQYCKVISLQLVKINEKKKKTTHTHIYIYSQLYSQVYLYIYSDGKEPVYNAGDLGPVSGWGRSPEGGNDNPLRYSCLENPMDREAGYSPWGLRVRHDWVTKHT